MAKKKIIILSFVLVLLLSSCSMLTGTSLHGLGTYPVNDRLDVGVTYYDDGQVAKSYGRTKITDIDINGSVHTFYSSQEKVISIDIKNNSVLYTNKELDLACYSYRDYSIELSLGDN